MVYNKASTLYGEYLKHRIGDLEREVWSMPKDRIYREPRNPVPPFQFDAQVVRVFDDMLNRSIPLYRDIIRHQGHLIARFYQEGTRIYDLGCSNGNLGAMVGHVMGQRPFTMIAVDNAQAMIEAYRTRFASPPSTMQIETRCEDIRETVIEKASVVVLNFTLQFIAPQHRDAMMARIFNGLQRDGIFLFCEKIIHNDAIIADLQQSMYYEFKRQNGYSELEISQKREALEQVLVPETLQTHLQRLSTAGFSTVDVWLKWFNFAALIAVK